MTSLDRIVSLLESLNDNLATRGEQCSSVVFEDLASKAEPKVTTKTYAGQPLSNAEITQAALAHAYAKRTINQLAADGWEESLDKALEKTLEYVEAHGPLP